MLASSTSIKRLLSESAKSVVIIIWAEKVSYVSFDVASCEEIQKLHNPETIKNIPPIIKAIVVPTEPETGTPLSVEGIETLPESVAAGLGEGVALTEALGEGVTVVAALGLGLVLGEGEVLGDGLGDASCGVAEFVASSIGYGLAVPYG